MKKMIGIILVVVLSTHLTAQKRFKDFIGSWEVIGDQSTRASLEVIDSLTIFLSYNGDKKKILDYKIDFLKSPIWFDFSTDDSSSSIVTVKSLIELMSDNMIKWQLFVDEDRADHFSASSGELLYLRRTRPVVSTALAGSSH